jgi:hypothetical protein
VLRQQREDDEDGHSAAQSFHSHKIEDHTGWIVPCTDDSAFRGILLLHKNSTSSSFLALNPHMPKRWMWTIIYSTN